MHNTIQSLDVMAAASQNGGSSTCIQRPKGESWEVTGRVLVVERDIWRLPLEECKFGVIVDVEALADLATDRKAIAYVGQLFREFCSDKHTLQMTLKHSQAATSQTGTAFSGAKTNA